MGFALLALVALLTSIAYQSSSGLTHSFVRLEIELESPAQADDVLVVNQNFGTGWVAGSHHEHRTVQPRQGLLSVALHAGDREVTLRYRPRSVAIGAMISVTALTVTIAWLVAPRLRRDASRSERPEAR